MRFAPGTPQSVIDAAEKEYLSGKSKKLSDTPQQPKPMTAKEKRDALRAETMKKEQERIAAIKAKRDALRAETMKKEQERIAAIKAKRDALRAETMKKERERIAAAKAKRNTPGGTRPEVPLPGKPRLVLDTPGGTRPEVPLPGQPRIDYGTGNQAPPGSPAAAFSEAKAAMKKGGMVKESAMMKKEGRGMAKANMQKIAGAAVKKHEKAMHGMKSGGMASKRADGIAQRGKTKGKIC